MVVNRMPAFRTAIAMLLLIFLLLPEAIYAEQADGEYTIGFNIMHADQKNASIAEGYWNQPAKLIIKDGAIRVQTTINKHAWVTGFATRYNGKMADVLTISVDEAANTRLTEFPIASLTDLVESEVSVTIEAIDYDHSYTMYFKFKPETLTLVQAADQSAEQSAPVATEPVEATAPSPAATEPVATITPLPAATTAPTSSPEASAATPAPSIAPLPSAGATNPAESTAVPSFGTDEEELTDSSASPAPTVIPAEAKDDGEAGIEPSSGNDDHPSEKSSSSDLAVIVVLVVLLAAVAAAAIVYKTRQNKK